MIRFDPTNLAGMRRLMNEHGANNTAYPGKNESGERVLISISLDKIVVSAFQTNGWIRKNTYYRDGSCDETFER